MCWHIGIQPLEELIEVSAVTIDAAEAAKDGDVVRYLPRPDVHRSQSVKLHTLSAEPQLVRSA